MPKTLVYVFGPDGAGKSSVVEGVQNALPDSVSFNGSHPETWPDTSWHEKIISDRLDASTLDPAFHIESMTRSYTMASELLCLGGISTVIIDSDLRAKAAVKATAWYGHTVSLDDMYGELYEAAASQVSPDVRQVGLHVTVGQGTPFERASLLMDRVSTRGETSSFDPTSVKAATSLVLGFDALEGVLQGRGDPFVRVETDGAYDTMALASQLTS